jgi:hypothetical protein
VRLRAFNPPSGLPFSRPATLTLYSILPIFQIPQSEPNTRLFARYSGHLSNGRVGTFALEEGLALRDTMYMWCLRHLNMTFVSLTALESETLQVGADYGNNYMVFITCFVCIRCE